MAGLHVPGWVDGRGGHWAAATPAQPRAPRAEEGPGIPGETKCPEKGLGRMEPHMSGSEGDFSRILLHPSVNYL